MSLISLDLILVFHEGIDDESAFPCKQANPEHFDFYEKIAWAYLRIPLEAETASR